MATFINGTGSIGSIKKEWLNTVNLFYENIDINIVRKEDAEAGKVDYDTYGIFFQEISRYIIGYINQWDDIPYGLEERNETVSHVDQELAPTFLNT